MRPMKLYDLDEVFDFGKKHKGQFITDVLYQDPLYLGWCVEQVEWFVLVDKVKVLYIEEMKKILRDDQQNNNTAVEHELMEEAFISNFESICKRKESLYVSRKKKNDKVNMSVADHDYYNNIDDEYGSSSRYNFVRDVLGGDPSAMWNID